MQKQLEQVKTPARTSTTRKGKNGQSLVPPAYDVATPGIMPIQRKKKEDDDLKKKKPLQRKAKEEDLKKKKPLQRKKKAEDDLSKKKPLQRKAQPGASSIPIDAPDSPLEKEADTVAKQVVRRMSASGDEKAAPLTPSGISRSATGSAAGSLYAPAHVASALETSKGEGQPLPNPLRTEMEGVIGSDLSGVRIHADSKAAELSEAVNAQAFTYGQDIYFNQGKYQPGSMDGRRLLGHEVGHVGQQVEMNSINRTKDFIQNEKDEKLKELESWYNKQTSKSSTNSRSLNIAYARLLFLLFEQPEGIGHSGPISSTALGATAETLLALHHYSGGGELSILSVGKRFVPAVLPISTIFLAAAELIFHDIWIKIDKEVKNEQFWQEKNRIDDLYENFIVMNSEENLTKFYSNIYNEYYKLISNSRKTDELRLIKIPEVVTINSSESFEKLLYNWLLKETRIVDNIDSIGNKSSGISLVSSSDNLHTILSKLYEVKTGIRSMNKFKQSDDLFQEDFISTFYEETCKKTLKIEYFSEAIKYYDIANNIEKSALISRKNLDSNEVANFIDYFPNGEFQAIIIKIKPINLEIFPNTKGLKFPKSVAISWTNGSDVIKRSEHPLISNQYEESMFPFFEGII